MISHIANCSIHLKPFESLSRLTLLQRHLFDISPTVLQSRVNELRGAGFIESNEGGYGLTPLGMELSKSFFPLYRFANKWADSLDKNEG